MNNSLADKTKAHALFLPGLLCDHELWDPLLASISDIITPHVADLSRDDNVADMARRAIDMLPNKQGQFVLFGLSMGGYVAFEIMRQAAQRVQKLVLFSTTARPNTPDSLAKRVDMINSVQHGDFQGVTLRIMPNLITRESTQNPVVAGTLMRMARHAGSDTFVRQQTANMHRTDSRPTLHQISCPTLIIGGQDDTVTPPAVLHEIAQEIKGSQLHLLSNCAHLPPLEQPDEVRKLVRQFLQA